MNEKFIYKDMIFKRDGSFKIYFEGTNNKNVDEEIIKGICDKYFSKIEIFRDITKIVGDIRTLFRDIDEEKLKIRCYKKNVFEYKINYENKSLIGYENQFYDEDLNYYFIYQTDGIFFNIINEKGNNVNYMNYNKYIDIYTKRLKELYGLNNIAINKITNEILYINEIYKLFYGRYPNYNSDNINIKIQNMIYILYEYGINFVDEYHFSNINEKRIPVSSNINSLIDNVKPYGKINSENIIIDKKYKERIKIIRESIKKSCSKDIDFETATLYLSMVLYTTKYNLKLGYTLEDVTDSLNCSKTIVKNGLRLYKNINKNVYEKN